MRKFGIWIVVIVLVICNGILLWQTLSYRKTLKAVVGQEAFLSLTEDDYLVDARGVYTMPTIGKYFVPEESTLQAAPSMSMVIFVSSKSDCGMNLSEFEVFKRLQPKLESRHQRIVAVCAPEDSLGTAQLLDSFSFRVPIVKQPFEQFSFKQMGISPKFMPFKVLYDSSYNAIYMRGGDNTWESQAEFEAAVLRLSRWVDEGILSVEAHSGGS